MNKLAKLGLVGLLSLGIGGCATAPMQSNRPPYYERIKTEEIKGDTITNVESEDVKKIRTYKLEDLSQLDSAFSFHVRKSDKEIISKKTVSYTPVSERIYKETYSNLSGRLEDRVLLEQKEKEGLRNIEEKKEEIVLCENEKVPYANVEIFFLGPGGPLIAKGMKADEDGAVFISFSGLKGSKINKEFFFHPYDIIAVLEAGLTNEGKKYFDEEQIVKKAGYEEVKQHISISISEDNLEGIAATNTRFSADLNMQKPNFDKIYQLFKKGVTRKIEEFFNFSKIEWNVIDAETRRPIDLIEARFIPVKTKTYEDIGKQQYILRSKYFVKGSDLFNKTEISPAKEFDIVYDSVLKFYNGSIMFNVPAPSVYKVEFTDREENARYRGFLTEVKFTGNEKSTIELERIGTKVEIDAEKSRGRIRRER